MQKDRKYDSTEQVVVLSVCVSCLFLYFTHIRYSFGGTLNRKWYGADEASFHF